MNSDLVKDLKEMDKNYIYIEGEICIQENTDDMHNINNLELGDDIDEFIDTSYVIGSKSSCYIFGITLSEDIKSFIENKDIDKPGYYFISILYKMDEKYYSDRMSTHLDLEQSSIEFVETLKSRKRKKRISEILDGDDNIFDFRL
jgi:hypothetical protein